MNNIIEQDHRAVKRLTKAGAANGIRILSPEETAKELPHYPGFGANLEKIGH
ncbi:MAG: hypothetical protein KME57_03905 [Scytonema hyalinum WJT4-NPBG1]|nr:hypothetical protein [Scytonema hyalinum WJT4-NPBG1]